MTNADATAFRFDMFDSLTPVQHHHLITLLRAGTTYIDHSVIYAYAFHLLDNALIRQ